MVNQQLRYVRLPEDDRPGLAQPLHQRSVALRPVRNAAGKADRRRRTGHQELLLDRDRNAVQRPEGLAAGPGGIGGGRLVPRPIEQGYHHRVQAWVHLFDALDMLFDHLPRRKVAGG